MYNHEYIILYDDILCFIQSVENGHLQETSTKLYYSREPQSNPSDVLIWFISHAVTCMVIAHLPATVTVHLPPSCKPGTVNILQVSVSSPSLQSVSNTAIRSVLPLLPLTVMVYTLLATSPGTAGVLVYKIYICMFS